MGGRGGGGEGEVIPFARAFFFNLYFVIYELVQSNCSSQTSALRLCHKKNAHENDCARTSGISSPSPAQSVLQREILTNHIHLASTSCRQRWGFRFSSPQTSRSSQDKSETLTCRSTLPDYALVNKSWTWMCCLLSSDVQIQFFSSQSGPWHP
jgi:hypothetical protein